MTYKYRTAIRIEGIGLSYADGSKGTLFSTEDVDHLTNYHSLPILKGDSITNVGASSDPYVADLKGSKYNFTFQGTDQAAELFLHQQTQTPYKLSAFVDSTATLLEVEGVVSNEDGESLEGTIAYLEDETVLLGTWNNSAQTFSGCTRHIHSSMFQSHSKGERLFTKVPYWKGRKVWLHTILNGELIEEDQGHITLEPKTNSLGTIIRFPVSSNINVLKNKVTNKEKEPVIIDRFQENSLRWKNSFGTTYLEGQIPNYTPGVYKNAQWDGAGRVTMFQIGSSGLIYARDREIWSNKPLLGSSFKEAKMEEGDPPKVVEDELYEVFVVSPALDEYMEEEVGFAVSATRGMPYPYHPLTIIAGLLFSTSNTTGSGEFYDLFNGKIGANLAWLFDDDIYTRFDELIEATSDLKVDQVILGWDGKPIEIWKEVQSLCRQYGFFFGQKMNGSLDISMLGMFDVIDWNNTKPLEIYDDTLLWEGSPTSSLDTIRAEVGSGLWKRARPVTVNSEGTSRRVADLGNLRQHSVKYSSVSQANAEALVQRLRDQGIFRYFSIPQLTVRVPSPYVYASEDRPDLGIGSIVSFKDFPLISKWLVSNQGVRVADIEGETQFGGMITSRTTDLHDLSVTITVLLTNYRIGNAIRLRAPSFEVTSYVDPPTYRVETSATSLFGDPSQDDTYWFAPGDHVEIWSDQGVRITNPGNLTKIQGIGNLAGTPVMTLTNWPSGSGMEVGYIVRLASSKRYINPNEVDSIIEDIKRPWVFLADDSGSISVLDDDDDDLTLILDDADIYGG